MSAVFFLEMGHIANKIRLIEKIKRINIFIRSIVMIILSVILWFTAQYNQKVNIALGTYNNIILYVFNAVLGTIIVCILATLISGSFVQKISYYGKNSLAIFSVHSFFLYIYAKLLSIILNQNINIMQNINTLLSFVGFVIVMVCLYWVPPFWDLTYGKIINAVLKNK